MDNLHKLEQLFAHFPGIGPRQARRFVYYLLAKSPSFIKEFTGLIDEVKKATGQCERCQRLFIHSSYLISPPSAGGSKNSICAICSDQSRDQFTLMIVARDSDFETIEKSGAYKGLYFILGGTVPVLDKEPEKRIRLKKLLERVSERFEKSANSNNDSAIKEIILSLNTTPDGEHTAEIVKEAVEKILGAQSLSSKEVHPIVTVLGRGLSTGAELEYADGETIRSALKNRA